MPTISSHSFFLSLAVKPGENSARSLDSRFTYSDFAVFVASFVGVWAVSILHVSSQWPGRRNNNKIVCVMENPEVRIQTEANAQIW